MLKANLNVDFRDICGNSIILQIPNDATVYHACQMLSKRLDYPDNSIFLVCLNREQNFYIDDDLIRDIINENQQYFLFLQVLEKKANKSTIQITNNLPQAEKFNPEYNQHSQTELNNNNNDIIRPNPNIPLQYSISNLLPQKFFNNLLLTNNWRPKHAIYKRYFQSLQMIPPDFQSKIDEIAALGFEVEDIKEALRTTNYNVVTAVDFLIQQNERGTNREINQFNYRPANLGSVFGRNKFQNRPFQKNQNNFVFVSNQKKSSSGFNFVNNKNQQNFSTFNQQNKPNFGQQVQKKMSQNNESSFNNQQNLPKNKNVFGSSKKPAFGQPNEQQSSFKQNMFSAPKSDAQNDFLQSDESSFDQQHFVPAKKFAFGNSKKHAFGQPNEQQSSFGQNKFSFTQSNFQRNDESSFDQQQNLPKKKFAFGNLKKHAFGQPNEQQSSFGQNKFSVAKSDAQNDESSFYQQQNSYKTKFGFGKSTYHETEQQGEQQDSFQVKKSVFGQPAEHGNQNEFDRPKKIAFGQNFTPRTEHQQAEFENQPYQKNFSFNVPKKHAFGQPNDQQSSFKQNKFSFAKSNVQNNFSQNNESSFDQQQNLPTKKFAFGSSKKHPFEQPNEQRNSFNYNKFSIANSDDDDDDDVDFIDDIGDQKKFSFNAQFGFHPNSQFKKVNFGRKSEPNNHSSQNSQHKFKFRVNEYTDDQQQSLQQDESFASKSFKFSFNNPNEDQFQQNSNNQRNDQSFNEPNEQNKPQFKFAFKKI